MAEVIITNTILNDIANAIREKTGETGLLLPNQFANAIGSIDLAPSSTPAGQTVSAQTVKMQDSTLTAIANAIRAKTGSSNLLLPGQMAAAIRGIPFNAAVTGPAFGTVNQFGQFYYSSSNQTKTLTFTRDELMPDADGREGAMFIVFHLMGKSSIRITPTGNNGTTVISSGSYYHPTGSDTSSFKAALATAYSTGDSISVSLKSGTLPTDEEYMFGFYYSTFTVYDTNLSITRKYYSTSGDSALLTGSGTADVQGVRTGLSPKSAIKKTASLNYYFNMYSKQTAGKSLITIVERDDITYSVGEDNVAGFDCSKPGMIWLNEGLTVANGVQRYASIYPRSTYAVGLVPKELEDRDMWIFDPAGTSVANNLKVNKGHLHLYSLQG